MEREFTIEELEQETAELLPPRLVMSTNGCCNPCRPCGLLSVDVSLHVGLCL